MKPLSRCYPTMPSKSVFSSLLQKQKFIQLLRKDHMNTVLLLLVASGFVLLCLLFMSFRIMLPTRYKLYLQHSLYLILNIKSQVDIKALAHAFELNRQGHVDSMKLNAIGKAPKDKIFKKYNEIELQLGNIERCRKLYERYLEWSPENCYAWSKYAELERSLAETERATAIFELAISQPALNMPELLWKAYIDIKISEGEFERTRALYERLLDRTKHYKVLVSFAKFEASAAEEEDENEDEDQEEDVLEHKQDCIKHAREPTHTTKTHLRVAHLLVLTLLLCALIRVAHRTVPTLLDVIAYGFMWIPCGSHLLVLIVLVSIFIQSIYSVNYFITRSKI